MTFIKSTLLLACAAAFATALALPAWAQDASQRMSRGQGASETPAHLRDTDMLAPAAAPVAAQQLVSRYTASKEYDWNDTTSQWVFIGEERFVYNADGSLKTRYYLEANTLDTIGRYSYSYNSRGQQVWRGGYSYDAAGPSWMYFTYDSTNYDATGNVLAQFTRNLNTAMQWVDNTRTLNIWDARGNRTETKTENYNSQTSTWSVVSARQTAHTYTPAGHPETIVISTWNSTNNAYDLRERDTITVNAAGVPTSYLAYLRVGGGWRLRLKYDSISWYDYVLPKLDSRNSRYIIQGRGTGNWVDSLRFTTAWQANNSYVNLRQTRAIQGWVPSSRQTSTYNNDGFYRGLLIESYVSASNSWRGIIGLRRTPTYAANQLDILEVINSSLNINTQQYDNTTKTEYTSHIQLTSLAGNTKHPLKLYPNPARDYVQVKVVPGLEGQLTLTNTLGQVVRTSTLSGESSIMLELNGLPAGIYQAQLTQAGQPTRTSKLLVQ